MTTERVSNPGFETGLIAPWTVTGGAYEISTLTKHSGTYSCYISIWTGTFTLTQDINANYVRSIDWWDYGGNFGTGTLKVYLGTTLLYTVSALNQAWTFHTFPVNQTGTKTLKFELVTGNTSNIACWIDDVSALAGDGPITNQCIITG